MAIGLMSFCLVAMVGVLPVGLSQERRSTEQLQALQALTAVVSDFKATDFSSATKTATYQMDVPKVNGVLALDQNLKGSGAGWDGTKQYHVNYSIEAPATRFANYRLTIKVFKTSQDNPTTESASYVESVVLKPAF